jgi:hypothetical protein
MVKIAGLSTALVLTCGLAFTQEEAQKPGTPATETGRAASSPAPTMATAPAVQSWHGILVDGNCASGGGASASSSASTDSQSSHENTADQKSSVDTGRPHKGHKNRSAETQNCPVSSSTGVFALKTEGGQVMKFDMVGNARTAETLKTKPAWTKNLSENKPIKTRVSGILNGDTITVTSIGQGYF